jgi:hypothetical protein
LEKFIGQNKKNSYIRIRKVHWSSLGKVYSTEQEKFIGRGLNENFIDQSQESSLGNVGKAH